MDKNTNEQRVIATWNVNSIRARLPIVTEWLRHHRPDVVLLQELKCVSEAFPWEEIGDLGYNCAVAGQKTWNGVAILSRFPIEDVTRCIPGFEDTQARYIEAFTAGIHVASVYVPNGQEPGSEKFIYKMGFMEALKKHLGTLLTRHERCVIGGDYNIAPHPTDMHDPHLSGTPRILCSLEEQKTLRSILNMGYTDALRVTHPHDMGPFTWWDYRSGSWESNKGFRIDHLLLSPEAADRLVSATVDTAPRSLERASDHAPVICILAHRE